MNANGWVTLCKRTDDPKLSFIEHVLLERGIPCRRNGSSWHADHVLEVAVTHEDAAWAVLALPARKEFDLPVRYGVSLDDVRDDHPCFADYPERLAARLAEEAEQFDPMHDGWVGKDGRP